MIRRWGAATVLVAMVMLPMALTVGEARRHERWRAHLGSSWVLLRHGEVWRLGTSSFVQGSHGFVAGIVVLLAFVPLAAWRLGSRVAVAAFLLGDWVSTLLVLLGARLLAAAGSSTAQHVLGHLDSGASAACYACAGAVAWSLPHGRFRRLAAVALVADLAIEGAVTHMLAEIQHPVAVLVGIAVAMLLASHHADEHHADARRATREVFRG